MQQACLFDARVFHRRYQPKNYAFQHSVMYLWVDLQDSDCLANLKLLSLNKRNVFSLNWRNYAFSADQRDNMRHYVLDNLHKAGFPGGLVTNIALLTMPQVLGYVFNPVSFWLCFDKADQLVAVVAEVNNTFGGRHCYACFRSDFAMMSYDDTLEQRKVHHVSPFCRIEGYYRFKFGLHQQHLRISIDYLNDNGEILLATGITARRKALSDRNLLYFFGLYPFMTLKVIFLIHYHALRLWWKGVPFFGKNPPPDPQILP